MWPYAYDNTTYLLTDEVITEVIEEPVYLDWPDDTAAPPAETYDDSLQNEALQEFREEQKSDVQQQPADAPPAPTAEDADPAALVEAAIARGDAAFEAGSYQQAQEEYVRALVHAGDDAGVRVALGLAEYALGAYGDASAAIRRALADSGALARSDFDLRLVYGRPDDAEAHRRALEDYVAQNPADSDALFLLGFVRYFSGQRVEGAAMLKGYLQHPDHDRSTLAFIEAAAWETNQSPAWDR